MKNKSWFVSAGSSIGKSHIDINKPNQDSYQYYSSPDGSIYAAVVCDGAGSAENAEIGSQYFSIEILKILEKLGKLLLERNESTPITDIRQYLIEKINLSRQALSSDLDELRTKHSTVVGVVILPKLDIALSLQIGDSEILTSKFKVKDDNYIDYFDSLNLPHAGTGDAEYANETYFVTQKNWEQYLQLTILDLSDMDMIVLMTDGCCDLVLDGGTKNNKVYRPFFSNLVFNLILQPDEKKRNEIIKSALANPATYPVTGDDKTIVTLIKNHMVKFKGLEPITENLIGQLSESPSIQPKPQNKLVKPSNTLDSKGKDTSQYGDEVGFSKSVINSSKNNKKNIDDTKTQVNPNMESDLDNYYQTLSTKQGKKSIKIFGYIFILLTIVIAAIGYWKKESISKVLDNKIFTEKNSDEVNPNTSNSKEHIDETSKHDSDQVQELEDRNTTGNSNTSPEITNSTINTENQVSEIDTSNTSFKDYKANEIKDITVNIENYLDQPEPKIEFYVEYLSSMKLNNMNTQPEVENIFKQQDISNIVSKDEKVVAFINKLTCQDVQDQVNIKVAKNNKLAKCSGNLDIFFKLNDTQDLHEIKLNHFSNIFKLKEAVVNIYFEVKPIEGTSS